MNLLVFCLFLAGGLLSWALFKFDWKKFSRSSLFKKIFMWVPIYIVFIGILYAGQWTRIVLFTAITFISFIEVRQASKQRWLGKYKLFWLAFVAALFHIALFIPQFSQEALAYVIIIGISSVCSDVMAFFMGQFFGNHHLPDALNKKKSYEGIAGQFIGAVLGVVLVKAFLYSATPLWLFAPIGLGSTIGDLANSYFKRQLRIKDWSTSLPGHGGYIDRLSSLVYAYVLTFYALLLIG